MAETITLIARLKDELSGEIKRTGKEVEDFDKKMKLAAVAAVGAGVALVALANKYGQLGAQIRDTAAGLDVSTDTLQAINYQFLQTGGGAETFAASMRGLTSFMRTASAGGAEQVQILASMGLSYERLAAMRPEDQFYAVTEALEAMTNGQKQAEAASALFGLRYSQRVLGTLRQTEGTMREASAAFKEMDIGISEQDVMTLAAFSDKMTLLKRSGEAMMAEMLLPVIDVLGRVADNWKPVITIMAGFTAAVLLNTGVVDKWAISMARATSRVGTLMGSLKTGVVGTMGLGAAMAFTTGKLYELYDAIHDAHEANLALGDNMEQTAELLQTAVSTGFMTADEAAESMDATFRELVQTASLSSGEFITLNEIYQNLRREIESTTVNMDIYIGRLEGVSKGSYEAAIAQAALQRSFAMGVFGADSMVVEQMDAVIENLRSMRDEAIRSGVELDRAFNMDTGGKLEGGTGLDGTFTKPLADGEVFKQMLLDIKTKMLDLSTVDLKDLLKVPPDVEKSMTGAAEKLEQVKAQGIQDQMAQQQQLNNLMLSGAQDMTKILLGGADDWEEQMLKAIIKLGIQMGMDMIVPGLGSIVAGFLPFQYGGTVRGAQTGTQVPDSGPYGDRHLYALERGEIVLPRQEIFQGGAVTTNRSVNLSVNFSTMFSGASKTDMLRAADMIRFALRERGIDIG